MPPQFSLQQRNFLAFEYHKRMGTNNFKADIEREFLQKFPGIRLPVVNQMRRIWKKQIENGTVNNCNSKASPGDTYSGRPRTQRTAENIGDVKNVMDRDAS